LSALPRRARRPPRSFFTPFPHADRNRRRRRDAAPALTNPHAARLASDVYNLNQNRIVRILYNIRASNPATFADC
jgi:hypothetical protein